MNFAVNLSVKKSNKPFEPSNITILIVLLYVLSITALPIIINTNNSRTFLNPNKSYKNVTANNVLGTNKRVAATAITIDTATYINNGQMLARQIDNDNLQNYISDAKGSVLKLNNSDGSNAQNYSYTAYGNIIGSPILLPQKITQAQQNNVNERSSRTLHALTMAKANSLPSARNIDINIPNSFQYNAERFDNDTDLQYLRARFYNPEIKRFLNQDSYNLLNRFGYVNGNPIMYSDPTGNNAALDNNVNFITAIGLGILCGGIITGLLVHHFIKLRNLKLRNLKRRAIPSIIVTPADENLDSGKHTISENKKAPAVTDGDAAPIDIDNEALSADTSDVGLITNSNSGGSKTRKVAFCKTFFGRIKTNTRTFAGCYGPNNYILLREQEGYENGYFSDKTNARDYKDKCAFAAQTLEVTQSTEIQYTNNYMNDSLGMWLLWAYKKMTYGKINDQFENRYGEEEIEEMTSRIEEYSITELTSAVKQAQLWQELAFFTSSSLV